MKSGENKIIHGSQNIRIADKRKNNYPYIVKKSGPVIKSRRRLPRFVFWPLFSITIFACLSFLFIWLDRNVWHRAIDTVLPAETSFLAYVPLNATNKQQAAFDVLARQIPSGESVTWGKIEALIAPALASNELISQARSSEAFKDVFAVAEVGADRVIIFDIAETKKLSDLGMAGELDGAGLYRLVQGVEDAIYIWRDRDRLYISQSSELLTRMKALQRSQQKSRLENWRKDEPATLANTEAYKKTFTTLNQSALARVFIDTSRRPDVLNPIDPAKLILLRIIGMDDLDQLFNSQLDDQKFVAMGIYPGKMNIDVQLRQTTTALSNESTKRRLADSLPSVLAGTAPDIYVEFNAAHSQMGSREAFFNLLRQRYGFDAKAELVQALNGRAGLLVGNDSSGASYFAFVGDYTDRVAAGDLVASILESLRRINKNAVADIQDEQIFIGSSQSVVEEITTTFGQPETSLSATLPLAESRKPSLYYVARLPGLVSLAQRSLGAQNSGSQASSELWSALNTLAQSMPTVRMSSVEGGGLISSTIQLELHKVSVNEKNQAEKVLNRLNVESRTTATNAARDSARLADIVILRAALDNFEKINGRYPAALSELVPGYIQALPYDPLTRSPYYYSNQDGNKSYSITTTFETVTSVGPPGSYCVTTKATNPVSTQGCKEE